MKANMKCSNCGADISTMNMSWGKWYKWYMLLMVPILLLGFYPMMRLYVFKGDAAKDLEISQVQKRINERSIDVTGLITNKGNYKFTSVTVEAEFYDQEGDFLDEDSDYLRSDIGPNAEEHFKITIITSDETLRSDNTKMKVKIGGANTSSF